MDRKSRPACPEPEELPIQYILSPTPYSPTVCLKKAELLKIAVNACVRQRCASEYSEVLPQ